MRAFSNCILSFNMYTHDMVWAIYALVHRSIRRRCDSGKLSKISYEIISFVDEQMVNDDETH